MNDSLQAYELVNQFSGRRVLITGGTDGIGLEIALKLSLLGARVYVCGRNSEKGSAAEAAAQAASRNTEGQAAGGRVSFIRADISQPEQIKAMLEKVDTEAGRLDYLVNNAADDTRSTLEAITEEQLHGQMAINLFSVVRVTQAALPLLRKGQGKSIVNLCTTNYMLGHVPFSLYNASKSGIIGFTRSVARELGPEGIRVNVVSPGWIMTRKQLEKYVTETDKQELLATQCLKRLIVAEDVIGPVIFLLSQMSGGVTGQNIVVDGGKVMQ
jgi:NAD(P)-dependent dehydrogenase (short-subunit alcohol dehydrogenase family)